MSANRLAATPDVLITWPSAFFLRVVGVTRLEERLARKMIFKGQTGQPPLPPPPPRPPPPSCSLPPPLRERRCFEGADTLVEWMSANRLAATPDVLITWRSAFRLKGVGVSRLDERLARKVISKGQTGRCLWREIVTDQRQWGQRVMAE